MKIIGILLLIIVGVIIILAGLFLYPVVRYPNVYKSTDNVFFEYSILKNADAPTFEVIDSTLSTAYFRDKNSVYYYSNKIKGADVATFVPLNDNYAKDKKRVFYQDSLLKNVDYGSFRVIDKDKAEDKLRKYE